MSVYCLKNLSCPLDHTEKSLCMGIITSVATYGVLQHKANLSVSQTVAISLLACTVGGWLGHRLFRS